MKHCKAKHLILRTEPSFICNPYFRVAIIISTDCTRIILSVSLDLVYEPL